MRLNIEEECFSRLSKFVDLMGIDAREAIGTLVFLWHDSQDILQTEGTFEQIVDWCRITKLPESEQNRWIRTLCKARFLTEVREGVFMIHGNEYQIDNRVKHLSKSRKGGESTKAKWAEKKKATAIATGLPQVGQSQATGRLKARQGKAMQGNEESMSAPDGSDDTTRESDLERIYQEYPKRNGDMKKKAGLAKLKKLVKTSSDYELALLAVKNYRAHLEATDKIGTEFVKMFSSFWDSQGDWKEWAVKQSTSKDQQPKVVGIRLVDLS